MFLVNGLVWTAAHPAWPRNGAVKKGAEKGIFKGFDYQTGELKKQIDVNPEEVGIIHHRCYIPKAVDKYILTSWPGIEFVDTANRTIKGICDGGSLQCKEDRQIIAYDQIESHRPGHSVE